MNIRLLACVICLLIAPLATADGGQGRSGGDGADSGGRSESGSGGHDDGRGGEGGQGSNGTGQAHQGGKGGQGEARHRCLQQGDDGPRRGPESPQGNGSASRSIRLGSSPGSAPTLTWTAQGLEDACGYKVYRSDPVGGKHLLAMVEATNSTYTDNSATSSGVTYEYFVQAVGRSGQSSVRSNSNFISYTGCNWVAISPFGNPPVLVNRECL